MKKLLSLALALAMAVSLVTFQTVGAQGAFTDSSSIRYTEAVDVISALKIVEGYADGSFGPSGGLSRQAAAKIICGLLLTPDRANQMPRTATQFTDVAADSSFAGYISYCYNQGIIGGYGGGLFGPRNGLTGYAFLKMLLGSLGYDQNIERYTGTGWQTNVWTQASLIGLTNGIENFDGAAQVTREAACQLAFNTLQADMVEYTGNTASSRRVRTSSSASSGNISATQSGGVNILQFAEDKFPTLVKNGGVEDAFGRPSTSWTLGGSPVGTYQAVTAKTYYNDVTTGTIYSDLGMSVSSSNVTLYLNGIKDGDASLTISRNGTTRLSAASTAASAAIGPGCEIQVFRDDANAITICVATWFVGKVNSVQSATSSRNRSIGIEAAAGEGNSPAGFAGNNRFETTSFNSGDVVAYTYSGKSGEGIQNVAALTSVQGSLDQYVSGTSLTLNGTSYTYAKKMAFAGGLSGEGSLTSGVSYVAYTMTLNNQRLVFWVENAAATVDGYALVTAVDPGNSFSSARARLLFPSGSVEVVNLSRAFEDVNVIVRYAVSNGNYTLTPIAASEFSESTSDFGIANRTASGLGSYSGGTISADGNTTFVVRQGDSYQVYTGVRNVPNVSGSNAKAYTYHDSGIARIVFVTDGTTTTTNRELTFIAANSASPVIRDSTSANGYRTFQAVRGGQIVQLKVESGIALDNTLAGSDEYGAGNSVLLDNVSSNTSGIVVSGDYTSTTITYAKADGHGAPTSGGQITIGGTRLNLAVSYNVWFVNAEGTIRAISPSDIGSDDDDCVLYTLNDGEITNLFILEV